MKKVICYITMMALALTLVAVPLSKDNVDASTDKVLKPKHVKAVKKSSSSIKISWSKVKDADGYVVYRKSPNKKKYKKIKTIKKSTKTKWVNKKLKKNKTYRYKIKAYKKIGGKKKYSKFTYSVSSKTFTKKQKKVNVKKVSVDYKNRYIGLKAYKKVNAKVKTKKGKKPISKKIRWYSSDKSMAKVDKKGGIRTQGKKGVCYVYAVAHNGVKAKLKVIVDDYANPDKFINLNKTPSVVQKLCTEDKEDLCQIASYLERIKGYSNLEIENGYLQTDIYLKESILLKIEKLIKEKNLTGVVVDKGIIMFWVNYKKYDDVGYIVYSDYNPKSWGRGKKLADCWFYIPPSRDGGV